MGNKGVKGITLISLVITIIVLIILSMVTISVLTGENGLLAMAAEARRRTEEAKEDEERMLADMEFMLLKQSGMSYELLAFGNNVYKHFENGDVFGIGQKGWQLNSKANELDSTVWQVFESPVPNTRAVFPGWDTIYVIDDNYNLWAWGSNAQNRLGLIGEAANSPLIMEPTKITDIKVEKIFSDNVRTFIVEKDTGRIFAAGNNDRGGLGVGNTNPVNTWTEVVIDGNIDLSNKSVYRILPGTNVNAGTIIWYKDNITGENIFLFSGGNPWRTTRIWGNTYSI